MQIEFSCEIQLSSIQVQPERWNNESSMEIWREQRNKPGNYAICNCLHSERGKNVANLNFRHQKVSLVEMYSNVDGFRYEIGSPFSYISNKSYQQKRVSDLQTENNFKVCNVEWAKLTFVSGNKTVFKFPVDDRKLNLFSLLWFYIFKKYLSTKFQQKFNKSK